MEDPGGAWRLAAVRGLPAAEAGTVGVLGVTTKVTASTRAVTTAPNTKVRVLDEVSTGRNRIGVS